MTFWDHSYSSRGGIAFLSGSTAESMRCISYRDLEIQTQKIVYNLGLSSKKKAWLAFMP